MKKLLLLVVILMGMQQVQAQTYDINNVAGKPDSIGYSGDGGQADTAKLNDPNYIAFDKQGNMYVDDFGNYRIRKIDTNGVITTVAGNGTKGYSGDNGPATSAEIGSSYGVSIDDSNNIYIADTSNNRIRKVSFLTGNISTFAGGGSNTIDTGNATNVKLSEISSVYVDDSNNVYISLISPKTYICKISDDRIKIIAGNGTSGSSGDNEQATSAELNKPFGICKDLSGNIYISDYGNNKIRKINTSGIISTFAGGGSTLGDEGQATLAKLDGPKDVSVDDSGNIYISDGGDSRIRKVKTNGVISTIAGNGDFGYADNGGNSDTSELNGVYGIVYNKSEIFISDQGNEIIRKLCTPPITPGSISGNTIVCPGSSQIYKINSVPGAYNYTWILPDTTWVGNSTDTSIIVTPGKTSGIISVIANGGCEPSNPSSLSVSTSSPEIAAICYVTVDTSSKYNIVIWNNTGFTHTDSFKVYFYNSSNQWQKLSELPKDSEYYIDTNSINNPNSSNVTYCLTSVDSCGNEESTALSNYQRTLFIINNGSGTFSWNGTGYYIMNNDTPVYNYTLYRDSIGNGHWEAIDSVSGSQNNVIADANYSNYPNGRWYVAATLNISGCPTIERSATRVISNSNRRNYTNSGINTLNKLSSYINVFPNPVSDNVNISMSKLISGELEIYNILGQEIFSEMINQNQNQKIDMSKFTQGVYFLKINNQFINKKIIKL